MRKVLVLSAIFFIANFVRAQQILDWTVSGNVSYAQPIGTLNSFFIGTPVYGLKLGQFTDSNLLWEFKLEAMRFTKPNRNALNPLVKDISLRLDIYGAAAEVTYFLMEERSWIKPYLTGSAGIYRWFYTRGSHYAIGLENSLDTTNFLQTFKLMDWSAGFSFGGGVNFEIVHSFAAYADLRYQIIVGELWQTLSLDMENVSSMQMVMVSLGFRYHF